VQCIHHLVHTRKWLNKYHSNYESNPDILPSPEAIILGFCTGLLSAACAISSKSLLDIVTIGTEMVCVSFRLAVWAKHRSMQIERSRGSWSAISQVPKETIQKALEKFHIDAVSYP